MVGGRNTKSTDFVLYFHVQENTFRSNIQFMTLYSGFLIVFNFCYLQYPIQSLKPDNIDFDICDDECQGGSFSIFVIISLDIL